MRGGAQKRIYGNLIIVCKTPKKKGRAFRNVSKNIYIFPTVKTACVLLLLRINLLTIPCFYEIYLNDLQQSSNNTPTTGVHCSPDSEFLSRGCIVTSNLMNKQVSFLKQETIGIIFNA